jgi:hypothetical protein
MRRELGTIVLSAVLSAVTMACGGADPGTPGGFRVASNAPAAPSSPASGAVADAPEAPPTCPSDVPLPRTLVKVPGEDLAIVDGNVWFRVGNALLDVSFAGGDTTTVYVSPRTLVRTFVDDSAILTVEKDSATPPVTSLHVVGLDGTVTLDLPTTWSAATTRPFASDAQSFYVVADVPDKGNAIVKVDKQSGAMATLASFGTDPIDDAQLVGTDVWFVRAHNHVHEVAQKDDGSGTLTAEPAKEVFASASAQCHLAVAPDAAYCSDGKVLVQRDLSGGSPRDVLDVAKLHAQTSIGAPVFAGKSLFLRPTADASGDPLGNVIGAIRSTSSGIEENLAACGRQAIGAVAAASSFVVWSEPTGIFVVLR